MAIGKHHHAVPVMLVLAALFALSAVALNHLTPGQYKLAQALTTRVIDIHPTTNGLAQLAAHNPPNSPVGSAGAQAGSGAALSFSFR